MAALARFIRSAQHVICFQCWSGIQSLNFFALLVSYYMFSLIYGLFSFIFIFLFCILTFGSVFPAFPTLIWWSLSAVFDFSFTPIILDYFTCYLLPSCFHSPHQPSVCPCINSHVFIVVLCCYATPFWNFGTFFGTYSKINCSVKLACICVLPVTLQNTASISYTG